MNVVAFISRDETLFWFQVYRIHNVRNVWMSLL